MMKRLLFMLLLRKFWNHKLWVKLYFRHGNMDVVAFLVSKVKVDTTLKDRYGHTATDLAKKSNHQTVYEFLLADDNIK